MRASADFPFGSLWLPTAMSYDKWVIGRAAKDFSADLSHDGVGRVGARREA